MKKKKLVFICVAVVLDYAAISYVKAVPEGSLGHDKMSKAKQLFINANLALSEERFIDAYVIAERLISGYAGDYQIGLYVDLYVNTFCFLDNDFRNGMLRPIPPGIKARIDTLKIKPDKDVIDLVTLAMLSNYPGDSVALEYLEEILQKFPNSIWRDWAEWMVIQEREYRPREKYKDKNPEERSKLLMRDLYVAGKKFIEEHPDSYMVPKILKATADWGHWGGCLSDDAAKQEAVDFCRRVLKDYPSAEYHCARAREILRELLGNSYQEQEGCSEEQDRLITLFYCHTPQLKEYKKYTTEYVENVMQVQVETKPRFPLLSYVLITTAVTIVIVSILFLLKKKTASRRE